MTEMTEGAEAGQVKRHAIRVLSALSTETLAFGSDIELAAAASAYVHRHVRRIHQSVAESGAEVLERGEGVCGGMVLAARDLAAEFGLRGDLAYALGGDVAHSMLQVEASSGPVLLDPYHGLVFIDPKSGAGLGIDETVAAAERGESPVLYVRRQQEGALDLANAYAVTDEDERVDFAFPRNFLGLDGYGLAGSGFTDIIEIDLPLGRTLGAPDWREPRENEPHPYSALAHERKPDGAHLSWAYILGSTANGYNVQHAYRVTGLSPGSPFVLSFYFANAYGKGQDAPVITYRQLTGGRGKVNARLEHTNRRADDPFEPQVVQARFVSDSTESLIATHAWGDFVLIGIGASSG